MNIIKLTRFDTANGQGIRDVIWVSGCLHQCKGCHNPKTWDKNVGTPMTEFDLAPLWDDLKNPHIEGVTFSGGDPLAPWNRDDTINFATWIKALFPDKTIWCYTGYLWEEVKDIPGINSFDVLVDGKFDESKKDVTLSWCGSSNQRVINVVESLKKDKVILF